MKRKVQTTSMFEPDVGDRNASGQGPNRGGLARRDERSTPPQGLSNRLHRADYHQPN